MACSACAVLLQHASPCWLPASPSWLPASPSWLLASLACILGLQCLRLRFGKVMLCKFACAHI